MRFYGFLALLFVLGVIVLYIMGDRRMPETQLIEQEIELNEQE